MPAQETQPLIRPAEKFEGQEANEQFVVLTGLAMESPFPNGTFVDPEDLKLIRGDKLSTLIINDQIRWPLNNILGAEGFVSWDGRAPNHMKDGKPSREVMQDFASRETEIPGVQFGLDIYIYPDNDGDEKLFAVSQNAHRVGAAKIKCLKDIPVRGQMSVYQLATMPEELSRLH